jgi:orotidine-5'-phosphate decarboxylase
MQPQQRATSALKPHERIIVALDVPTRQEALQFVGDLRGLISFYKVGLELLMSGGMEELLQSLVRENHVFVDLKLPGDIPETVRRVVDVAARMGVRFITLSNSVTPGTIRTAVDGRSGRPNPQLLYVSFLSSLDRSDFADQYERDESEFDSFLEERTAKAKTAGADGFIVSGQEIGLLRKRYPDALLVSPGIRPVGASSDDHKRSCTPSEAIRLGADYIVVGRPIRDASNRQDAAKRIIDEIAQAASV